MLAFGLPGHGEWIVVLILGVLFALMVARRVTSKKYTSTPRTNLGEFEVDVIEQDDKPSRVVSVQARNAEEASNKVAAMGVQVGDVRLVRMVEEGGTSVQSAGESQMRADAGYALALSIIGLVVCGPIAIIGLLWGLSLRQQSAGSFGSGAYITGIVAVSIWGFWLLIQIALIAV